MGFEKFSKMIGNIASTTAKKAGEQAQIAKLGIDKAGIQRQIEGVYTAIGRYCYSKIKAGETMPEELMDYCRDIDALMQQIADLDLDIQQHKNERDTAEYGIERDVPTDKTGTVVEVEAVEVQEATEPVASEEAADKG
ncbi:MAG: hypothetical protein ACK5L0_02825 [Candidatus Fimivivens sp.]